MPLAAIPFLLIPYDSLTYLLGLDPGETSQTLPFTAIFSLIYLALRKGRPRLSPTGARVFKYLCATTVCVTLVTVANILLESAGMFQVDSALRMSTAPRQGISLALGLTSFLMFQDALVRLPLHKAFRWTVLGGLPSLAMCAFQIVHGDYRIQGFSSEPSQLGDMLVLSFLPACAFARLRVYQRTVVMMSGAVSLLAAFSGTALMKAVFAIFSLSAVRGHFARGLIITACALALIYGVLLLYPDNYIFNLYSLFQVYLDSGTLVGGSFIDRFFGFVGPLRTLGELHGWFGLGLGGDTVYFDRIFDPDTAAAIRNEKGAIASISSLQAKMLLYGGVLGYILYLAAWFTAWRDTPKRHPARFMIPTVLAASLFSIGPLFLPYVWLWLAIGSTAKTQRDSAASGITEPDPLHTDANVRLSPS
jgi:hypothetical protein